MKRMVRKSGHFSGSCRTTDRSKSRWKNKNQRAKRKRKRSRKTLNLDNKAYELTTPYTTFARHT